MKTLFFLAIVFISIPGFGQDSSGTAVKMSKSELLRLQKIESEKFMNSISKGEQNSSGYAYVDSLESEKKSAMTSFLLSTVIPIPGAGQIYNDDYWKATAQIAAFVLGVILIANSQNSIANENGIAQIVAVLTEAGPQALAGGVIIISSKIWSMIDAPIESKRRNELLNNKIERFKSLRQQHEQNRK